MGKLKNALMELQSDDMRFGQSIEDLSTDALTLLQAEDIDDLTRLRVEHELSRRNGIPVERIAVDQPDPNDIPHIDLVVYDLSRITNYLEEHPDQADENRLDIKEYVYRINKVLEAGSGN